MFEVYLIETSFVVMHIACQWVHVLYVYRVHVVYAHNDPPEEMIAHQSDNLLNCTLFVFIII